MVKKCKVMSRSPDKQTCVFEYDNTCAYITGNVNIYDGYVYIERTGNAFKSVEKPKPEKKVIKETIVKESVAEA